MINKNTIQISYSTTANFEAKIKQHNNNTLRGKGQNKKNVAAKILNIHMRGTVDKQTSFTKQLQNLDHRISLIMRRKMNY